MANLVKATFMRNMRDRNINMDTGRFTMGSRRASHAGISRQLDRHTLHRLCLGNFRVVIHGDGP